jgi:intracellular sulfur oxidation DsrE/DsrF family protein
MQKYDVIDDNILGMFVDDQLDPVLRELVLNAMEDDPGVRESVYKLRRAKDLMKLSFGNAKAPEHNQAAPLSIPDSSKWRPGVFGLAASVMIMITSFSIGYYLAYPGSKYGQYENTRTMEPMAQDRVLLHVSESDPDKFSDVLVYARKFLDKYKKSGGQVAVVAHANGLDMVREGVSPVQNEIMVMMRDYENIHFIACASSIIELREKGIENVIMENIDASQPAMDQIISHVQDGWSYIRVKELPEV